MTHPAPRPTSTYYSGASCGTKWYLYGTWYDLGSTVDGCGDAYYRTQTGNHGNVDWYFNTGPTVSCTISMYIPGSTNISATAAHYELYAASDHSNLIANVKLSQASARGGWLTIGTYSTPTGSFDLFLYDDKDTEKVEAAAAATATCS